VTGPDRADTDELLRQADTAMYQAKRTKDTGWAIYNDDPVAAAVDPSAVSAAASA
jgi:predicted signal transduction protein with EAL and GGDEF domain